MTKEKIIEAIKPMPEDNDILPERFVVLDKMEQG